jgi:hypothetical protein
VKSRSKGPVAADVQTSDDAQDRYSGMLSFLDNVVDRSTGTITARATISNPNHTLLPGEFVHVRVHIADQPNTLLVPQVALGSSQLGRFVYVIGKDGKAEQRIVSPGANYGSLVVIDKGVAVGDKIIVGNLQKIAGGVPVAPEPSAPSLSHCRVQPLQLHAGVSGGELPIGFDMFLVAGMLPGGDFLGQGLLVRDAAIETLAGQHAEFGLGHVEPTAVFGCVVPFEPFDEAARLGCGERFVE